MYSPESIQRAARLFVTHALRADDSLFTPGRHVWSGETVNRLRDVFPRSDRSKLLFSRDLSFSLESTPGTVVQLAAELYFVHLLLQQIGGRNKRDAIELILKLANARADTVISIPSRLAEALDAEVPSRQFTPDHHAHRPAQLRFLLEFIHRWKDLSDQQVDQALANAEEFNQVAHNPVTPDPDERHARQQRRALIELLRLGTPTTDENPVSMPQT